MFLKDVAISKITKCAKISPTHIASIYCSERQSHALALFLEGDCDYIYNGKTFTAKEGSLLFLPKGLPYIINRRAPSKCIFVNFETDSSEPLSPFIASFPSFPKFKDSFQNMLWVSRQKRVGYEAEMMGWLYKIIALIQASQNANYFPEAKIKMISPAVEYINENYLGGEIKISYLAKLCQISTRYFGELFSVFFGVSPKEYILQKQLDTAKNLLASTEDNISEIALACGFSDIYYFSRVFKKHSGITPREYRRQNKSI